MAPNPHNAGGCSYEGVPVMSIADPKALRVSVFLFPAEFTL
jgi:hypothetical protein